MQNKSKAILLMLFSAMSFAMMQIMVALTGGNIPLFEQVFFRNFVASIVTFFPIRRQQLPYFGQRKHRGLLSARSFFGYMGVLTTFYASGSGNQGDVTTIMKMSPFVVTVLAYFFMKEKITKYQIIGLIVATTGVYFVANPEFNSDMLPIIAASVCCVVSGIAYTLVGYLKGKERPEVIIFYFSFTSTVVTIPLMLLNFVVPSLLELVLLLAIGSFAAMGQIALTYGYTYAKASEVSIYNYSGIVFSILFGYLFLGQGVKITTLIGAFLVIAAGAIVFVGNKHQERLEAEKR